MSQSGILSTNEISPISIRWLIAQAVLVVVLFGEIMVQLAGAWLDDPNYSHGFLVLPISIALAWRYCAGASVPRRPNAALGMIEISVGCLLQMTGMLLPVWWLQFFAMALVLQGAAVSIGGREWARGFLFPILFLFFMFPLPRLWTGLSALWLQDCVSRTSAFVLNLLVVCDHRGTQLYLPGLEQPLVVAEACSGLRQIVAFVALGALIGHLSKRGPLFSGLLITAALPVAIVANTVRVTIMGLGAYYYGTDWLNGPLHHLPALFSFPFGLVLFLVTWWCLYRLVRIAGNEENVD